jgi:hypothetical protein
VTVAATSGTAAGTGAASAPQGSLSAGSGAASGTGAAAASAVAVATASASASASGAAGATGTIIAAASGSASGSGATSGISLQKVIMLLLPGQSNNEGRVAPDRAVLDVDVTDGYQFEGYSGRTSTYQTIQSDITPLWHRQGYTDISAPQDRLGDGEYQIRQLLADNPGAKVVAVPCAQGSTPLVGGGTSWQAGNPGATLFENMISQGTLCYAAIQAMWPGAVIETVLSMVQGEQDAGNGVSYSTYLSAITSFVSFSRSRFATAGIAGASTMKVVLGSMIPQLWKIGSPNYNAAYAAINAAHVAASLTISGVYYADGPSGSTDGLHYSPASVVRTQGLKNAAVLSDTTGPTVTTASTFTSQTGQKLAFLLTGSDTHQTFHITGGADAAQFELNDPYLSPQVQWVGNGTGPAPGSYQVEVTARDGSGNYGTPKLLTFPVADDVSPATWFTNGERGRVWDLTNLANLSQTIDGLTPVTAVGQPVGWVKDLSPNADHWIAAANNTTRMTYQVDSDGQPCLRADGSNDIMFASLPFTHLASGKFTSIIGIKAAAPASQRYIIGSYPASGTITFMEPFSATTAGDLTTSMRNDASGGAGTQPTIAGALDGTTKRVATSQYFGNADKIRMRDRAARDPTTSLGGYSTVTQGTFANNFTVVRDALGGRGFSTPSGFFPGDIYSGAVIDRPTTDAETKSGEDWAALRTLATATVSSAAGSAAGTGAAAATAVAVLPSAGTASGAGQVTGAAQAIAAASGAASGSGATAGAAQTLAQASGTAAASGAASAASQAGVTAGAATGLGAAAAVGVTIAASSGAAAGQGQSSGAPSGVNNGQASGLGAASAAAVMVAQASGSASGTSSANGNTSGAASNTGAAGGAGTAQAGGLAIVAASGSASAGGAASGPSVAVGQSVGLAAGTGAQAGDGRAISSTSGASAASGDAQGQTGTTAIRSAAGNAAGIGTASAQPASVASAAGTASASGSGSAAGAGIATSSGAANGFGAVNVIDARALFAAVAAASGSGGSGAVGRSTASSSGQASGFGSSLSDPSGATSAHGNAAGNSGASGQGQAPIVALPTVNTFRAPANEPFRTSRSTGTFGRQASSKFKGWR